VRKLREKQEQRRQRLRNGRWRRVGMSACTYVLSVPLCVAGLAGLLYFLPLFRSVSTVPECDSAYAMRVSLLCCCAFWLLDAALLFIWSLSLTIPSHDECASHPTREYFHPRVRTETIFWWCNTFGIVSNIGVWSSAAACVHYSNACMGVYPSVAFPTRAFAAVSLTFGIVLADFGILILSEV
jgi:hypothetical protein